MEALLRLVTDGQASPLLVALVLGLLVTLSPCALASNTAALGYLLRALSKKEALLKSAFYVLGRTAAYLLLAVVFFYGGRGLGLSVLLQTWGERLAGPALVFFGLALLPFIPYPQISFNLFNTQTIEARSIWGATALGFALSLAFCPYSGALFFGLLIPMIMQSSEPVSLPSAFSFGAALPTALLAYAFTISTGAVARRFGALKARGVALRYISSTLMILAGLYLIYAVYF